MPKITKKPAPVDKCPTGITGFDEITEGGLPRGRVSVLMGGTGSGKTVFALQNLVNGARTYGEAGIFVAFEENAREIVTNSAGFGWDVPGLIAQDRLFIFDARVTPDLIVSGRFDLTGILAGLTLKVTAMKARRIVFDSVDVLLTLLNDPMALRQEVYRLCDWLTDNQLTGIFTMKTDAIDPAVRDYGFMQFRSDCVVALSRQLISRFSMRDLQVVKFRGSAHSEDLIPFAILQNGIEVAASSSKELVRAVSNERVSMGVPQLDEMLGGGPYRGSSTLITGAPGTAKTILSGAFVAAACARGERAVYVTFDENAEEIQRNLTSVSIDIKDNCKRGQMRFFAARTEASAGQVHLIKIKKLVDEFKPQCVVIDPISALIRAGGEMSAESVVERLLYHLRARGVTVICTSIVEEKEPLLGATPLYITTMVDAWIHVTYFIQNGERNRSLSIVKSRGMKHSNRVCELILRDEGVSLADVHVAGGEVIMGSMRWNQILAEDAEKARAEAEIEKARQEVELAEAELPGRVEALRRQIEIKHAGLEVLRARQAQREATIVHEDASGLSPGAREADRPPPLAAAKAEARARAAGGAKAAGKKAGNTPRSKGAAPSAKRKGSAR